MFTIHVSRDGERCYVYEMEDAHLVNYLNLALGHLTDAMTLVSLPEESPTDRTRYLDELYDRPKRPEPEELASGVRQMMNRLAPYLAELFIRDLPGAEEIRTQLRAILGREGRRPRSEAERAFLALPF